MKKALVSGKLDEVNKVLGEMKIDDAEELVGLFGEVWFNINDTNFYTNNFIGQYLESRGRDYRCDDGGGQTTVEGERSSRVWRGDPYRRS